MIMCNLVTNCKVVTRLRWDGENITMCDEVVTNMTLWSQDCSELVKVLHGCDKVGLQRPSSGAVACVLVVTQDWTALE